MNLFEPDIRAGGHASIRFTGRNPAFRRLVTRGALLELLTVGFYRFWLNTDIRRHLWAETEIDGDALEYTGRGKELLLGFLAALAVLAPLFLVSFLLGLAFTPRVKLIFSLPLYAFIFALAQFAAYRARRYRLTRTVWRGVRFWMNGSGWAYAARALLWGLLLIPTLGFAYPWRMAALERYKLGHTFYGNLPGRFAATGTQLFKRVWWIWLLGLLPPALLYGTLVVAMIAKIMGPPSQSPAMATAGPFIIAGFISLIALPFLHAARKATEWQWWADGIRFGDAAVTCHLPRTGLFGVYWPLIGLGLLAMLACSALGGVLAALLGHATGRSFVASMSQRPLAASVAYGIVYVLLLLTINTLTRIYLLQRVWQRVANTCRLLNPTAADNVTAAGEAVSAFGEGLADNLDFAGF